jgi:hypothetical protein
MTKVEALIPRKGALGRSAELNKGNRAMGKLSPSVSFHLLASVCTSQ